MPEARASSGFSSDAADLQAERGAREEQPAAGHDQRRDQDDDAAASSRSHRRRDVNEPPIGSEIDLYWPPIRPRTISRMISPSA